MEISFVVIMLQGVSSAEDLAGALDRAPGNGVGPRTRGNFKFQDVCVALRCIPNLLPGSPLKAVVVEWSTDYVLLAEDGQFELVSVKHRDPGQNDWTFAMLRAENVFRDLHAVWRAMGESGTYVFESNAGFTRDLRPWVGSSGRDIEPDQGAVGKLTDHLRADPDEVRRFMRSFILRSEELPSRLHIEAVAQQQLAKVIQELGMDVTRAQRCLTELIGRIAATSTELPPGPLDRVARLIGFTRDVEERSRRTAARSMVTMEELRALVEEGASSSARHGMVPLMVGDPLFVGRDCELERLGELLRPGEEGTVRPVALTGMPGIGKTALASRFAAIHGSTLQAYVLPADTRTALAAAIDALNPQPEPVRPPTAVGPPLAGRLYPSLPDDPGLLAIVDGLTDPAVIDGLIMRQSRTRVLITATCRHVDDAFSHIQVDGFTVDDGRAYLRQVMSDTDASELDRMFTAFDGHPLGLAQGANYCRSEGISPEGYLRRLQQYPARMLNLGRSPGHPIPLGPAIEIAFAAAAEYDEVASDLAAVIAWFASEPVPEWIFDRPPMILQRGDGEGTPQRAGEEEVFKRAAALAKAPALDRGVEALQRHGLLTRTRRGLQVHPLIQTVARSGISQESKSTWIESALGLLLGPMQDAPEELQGALVPHVAAIAEAAAAADVDPLALCAALRWLGHRHLRFGTFKDARNYQEKARALAEGTSLPKHVIFTCLSELVATYRNEGDSGAALATAADWLSAAEAAGDENAAHHARRAQAHTLVYSRRFGEAARAFAAVIADRVHEPDLSEQIIDLSAAAELECALARYSEALVMVDRAVELADGVASEVRRHDHLTVLHAQASMIFHMLERGEEALARQRQSLEAARGFIDGVYLATPLYGLANRLLDLEIEEEVEQVIAEGMDLVRARGTNSPEYGKFLHAAGRLAILRKDWPQAERLLVEAAELVGRGGDPYRIEVAVVLYNLGTAYAAQLKSSLAVSSLQRARDIDAAIYGDQHPEVLADEYSLAAAHQLNGQNSAARASINRALRIIKNGRSVSRLTRDRVITTAIVIDLNANASR
jgi:tetratricopeptide (TPR) repeat protein